AARATIANGISFSRSLLLPGTAGATGGFAAAVDPFGPGAIEGLAEAVVSAIGVTSSRASEQETCRADRREVALRISCQDREWPEQDWPAWPAIVRIPVLRSADPPISPGSRLGMTL